MALVVQRNFSRLLVMMKINVLIVTLTAVVLGACQQAQQGTDSEDSTNPYFRRALNYEEDQNYYAAIQEYEKALVANASVAKAHVEMGVLYNEKLGDPISAIYHYQKYLNARPNAPDREKVQSYLDKAKIDFAITLPNSPAQNAEEIARINRENVDLKQALADAQKEMTRKEDEIARLRSGLGSSVQSATSSAGVSVQAGGENARLSVNPNEGTATVTTTSNVPVALPIEGGIQPVEVTSQPVTNRTYTIQKGDSLWKISTQFYPDDVARGVERIKEANPQKASNPQNLKLGDVLTIP
jgi:nucleoid-associated protein YgaU